MEDSTNDIRMIEKFLDGKMTTEEKKEFEGKLDLDQTLKAMLTDMNLLIEGIKISAAQTSEDEKVDRLKFFTEINQIENDTPLEISTQAKVIPLYRNVWLWSAAASIILMVSLATYFMSDRTPLNEKLYAANFEPFDSPGSGMTRGINEANIKTQAYEAYDNGNYIEAARLFEQITKEKEDPIAELCLGNAYLAQNERTDDAVRVFTKMITEHTELITQAKWYLALAYLKQNKLEKTKATLWEISKSSTYGEKAQQLLKELD